ncbi:MAG TPA: OB-fold domain-containing protein [Acidimicrobiia bacterium]
MTARFEPPTTDASDPFWAATREQRYVVQWCAACARPIFYPRDVCPACLSTDSLEWRESTGKGTVYAVSVQHRPANPTMADRVPYAVALVEVDAGDRAGDRDGATIRVMSNIVGTDPLTIEVGDAVSVAWEPLSDGRNLPVFERIERIGRGE